MTGPKPLQPVASSVAGSSGEAVAVRCVAPPYKGVPRCNGNAPELQPATPEQETLPGQGIAAAGGFGPWATGLTDAERLARWRSLRAVAGLLVGPSSPLVRELRAAETDAAAGERALVEFNRLPTMALRQVLAAYARIAAPGELPVCQAAQVRGPGSAKYRRKFVTPAEGQTP